MKQLILVGGRGLSSSLCTHDGLILESYEQMKNSLRRRKRLSIASAESYLEHIARMHEYIYTAWLLGISPTYDNLQSLLDHYEEYLLFGTQSSIPVVCEIAKQTGKTTPTSPSSLPVIEAAIKHFLRLSDEHARAGNTEKLFTMYAPNMTEPLSSGQASRLKMSSKLAGLIRSGPKNRRAPGEGIFRFSKSTRANNSTLKPVADRAFPTDRTDALIEGCQTYRDKALYAFLMASGCRSFEAMQLTWSDLNALKREAIIVNPFTRPNPGISAEEFQKLRWKGRAHYEAFMVQPWEDVFWDNLKAYLDSEYIPGTGHDFVFQTLIGPKRGRPYFTSDRASRTRAFKKQAKKAGVELVHGVAVHSLRHGYGMYCLNDHPNSDGGFGLDLVDVNKMIAHRHLGSTRVYAKADSKRVRSELALNRKLHAADTAKGKREAMRDHFYSKYLEFCDDKPE
jgi:integrase